MIPSRLAQHIVALFLSMTLSAEWVHSQILGARGGCYVYSSSGRKRYVERSRCAGGNADQVFIGETAVAPPSPAPVPRASPSGENWPSPSRCLVVGAWSVTPVAGMSGLSVTVQNKCKSARMARGIVRLWDSQNLLIGEEDVYLGKVPEGKQPATIRVAFPGDLGGIDIVRIDDHDWAVK